jgi:hypothetical protein
MNWKNKVGLAISVVAASHFASSGAHAGSLVLNGSFESTSIVSPAPQYAASADGGQLGYNINATGWTTTGYNFIFAPGTADNGTGVNGQSGGLQLWGPGNGSNNGMPTTSPDGGNFIAADGAYNVGAISQTISGLTAGDTYAVGFYWAGAQQYTYTTPTTEQWQVSLGNQTLSTNVVNNLSEGFTGWTYTTLDFTATSTSELLSFLAVGTPTGVPPFSLLDGVTMQAVPEPSALMLLAVGLCGVAAVSLRRRAKSAAA